MKILITGIGCIGKSTLREKITSAFPEKVVSVDMDYENKIPQIKNKIVVVESVHGLEEKPQMFDKILYLLPPEAHLIFWLRRAWIWFETGVVDLSKPKGKRKKFSISNIPIITKILGRNILISKKWVKSDLYYIEEKLKDKTHIALSIDEGYRMLTTWISNYSKLGEFKDS
jgi:hypothetical protein